MIEAKNKLSIVATTKLVKEVESESRRERRPSEKSIKMGGGP